MTKNPHGPDRSAEAGGPPDSGGTATATAAPAADPTTAADTVTGAPGTVSVPGTTVADFGPLSPQAADELGTVLQAMNDSGCPMVVVGRASDGSPILEPKCPPPPPTGPKKESNTFLELWVTDILLAENIMPHWKQSNSRYEAALERASRKSEKIRVLAEKAVDLLDAASANPYYVPDEKTVLSKSVKADCKIIADRLRGALVGQPEALADLFDSIATGRPLNQNEVDLGLAGAQLYGLRPGTRSWLHKKSQDELKAAKQAHNGGDAFFWRTMARGTAPGRREF